MQQRIVNGECRKESRAGWLGKVPARRRGKSRGLFHFDRLTVRVMSYEILVINFRINLCCYLNLCVWICKSSITEAAIPLGLLFHTTSHMGIQLY